MKKSVRGACILALCLLLLGALVFGAALFLGARPQNLWDGTSYRLPDWIQLGKADIPLRDWENDFMSTGIYTVSSAGVDAIDLRWAGGPVTVRVTDGKELLFKESASSALDQSQALRWGLEDGVLFVQHCSSDRRQERLPAKSLELEIPQDMAQSLRFFQFSGGSASLTVSDLWTEAFSFDSASGALQAQEIQAGRVRLDASSGSLDFSGSYDSLEAGSSSGAITVESLGNGAKETFVETTSGKITLSGSMGDLELESTSGGVNSQGEVLAERLSADLTSGALHLSGSFEEVFVESTSGRVELSSAVCPKVLEVDSTSGSVHLTLPQDSGFTLEFDSASGTLRCDLPSSSQGGRLTCGSGEGRFQVNSASGNLTITTP